MTDKVQKIKDWISKEQDGLMDAQGNFEYPEHEGAYHILCNLDAYIDSLQEEPTIPDIVDEHYWEMLGEEPQKPASEELEKIVEEITEPTVLNAYGTKELARRLRNTVIYGTSVSKELEEEIENYIKRNGYDGLDSIEEVKYIANHFTNWQKLQDMGITNKAQDVVANILSSADNPLDAYATEVAFIMIPATLKESYHHTNRDRIGDAIKLGAKWQKEKDDEEKVLTYKHGFEDCKEQMMKNIWKPADGDDIPEIDREVIALLNNGKVVFAHRPYKGKYIGKNLTTGNIETFENKTYDKGGWNQPDIRWWLDCSLPNMED